MVLYLYALILVQEETFDFYMEESFMLSVDQNKISVKNLTIQAQDYVPAKAILKGVRVSRAKDAEGNLTNGIEAVRYDVVNPINYDTLTIKVNGKDPVITQEEIEEAEMIFLVIPVDKTILRPYKIEYGKAYVSIIAPAVAISMD